MNATKSMWLTRAYRLTASVRSLITPRVRATVAALGIGFGLVGIGYGSFVVLNAQSIKMRLARDQAELVTPANMGVWMARHAHSSTYNCVYSAIGEQLETNVSVSMHDLKLAHSTCTEAVVKKTAEEEAVAAGNAMREHVKNWRIAK